MSRYFPVSFGFVMLVMSSAAFAQVPTNVKVEFSIGHDDDITTLSLSPRIRYFATGSEDFTVKIWDVGSGKPVKTHQSESAIVKVWYINEDCVLIVARDGRIYTWDIWSDHVEDVMKMQSTLDDADYRKKDDILTVCTYAAVYVIDVLRKKVIYQENCDGYPLLPRLHPDRPWIAFKPDDKRITIVDFKGGNVVKQMSGFGSEPRHIDFSPDGERFLVTDMYVWKKNDDSYERYRTKVWDCPTWSLLDSVRHQSSFGTVRFVMNGNSIISAASWRQNNNENGFTIVHLDSAVESESAKGVGERMVDVQWSSEHGFLAVAGLREVSFFQIQYSVTKGMRKINRKGGGSYQEYREERKHKQVVRLESKTDPLVNVACYPQASLVAGIHEHELDLWDLRTGQLIGSFGNTATREGSTHPTYFDVSRDGRYYAVGGDILRVFDAKTHALVFDSYSLAGTDSLAEDSGLMDINTVFFGTDSAVNTLAYGTQNGQLFHLKLTEKITRELIYTVDEPIGCIYRKGYGVYGVVAHSNIVTLSGEKEGVKEFKTSKRPVTGVAISPHNKFLSLWSSNVQGSPGEPYQYIEIFDIQTQSLLAVSDMLAKETYLKSRTGFHFAFGDGDKQLYYSRDGKIFVYDIRREKTQKVFDTLYVTTLKLDATNADLLYAGTSWGSVLVIDTRTWAVRRVFNVSQSTVKALEQLSEKQLAIACHDGGIRILNLVDGAVVRLQAFKDDSFILTGPENSFITSSGHADNIAFLMGEKQVSYENVGWQAGKPNIILEMLGFVEKDLLDKIKAGSATGASTLDSSRRPRIHIISDERLPIISSRSYQLNLEASGANAIDLWQVNVNGIDLFPGEGKHFQNAMRHVRVDTTILLSGGRNSIAVRCTDIYGTRSVMEKVYVVCDIQKSGSTNKTFLFSAGISNYTDTSLPPIEFAEKDARDMISYFNRNFLADDVWRALRDRRRPHKDTLLIQNNATHKNIAKCAADLFAQATEDDVVIFYFSGHGMLDEFDDFYFCTVDTNPSQPGTTALSLEDVLNIFSQSRARRRLLIIDACNSGLISGDIVFNNLFPSTNIAYGVNIFASSTGLEASMTNFKYQNSMFTYTLLDYLKAHYDDQVSLLELQKHVYSKVLQLTEQAQTPNLTSLNVTQGDMVLGL